MTATTEIQDHRGDSATYLFTVLDLDDEVVNITGWEFRCEIWDTQATPNVLKKASSGIAGGGDDQIVIVSATAGTFKVLIDTGETLLFSKISNIQIVAFVEDTRDTIYDDQIKFFTRKITEGA